MKFDEIHPSELDDGLLASWRTIVGEHEHLRSPYFAPEFTMCVGQTRKDARVAVIRQDGQTVGFLPYQRRALGRARPIGLALSDYQGIIAAESTPVDMIALLKACKLRSFSFDHLLQNQKPFQQFHTAVDRSPTIDLRAGYEPYCQARRDAGSKQILKLGTLQRKLEREHEPLRFELKCNPSDALAKVMAWKSRQCLDSGGIDIFAHAWTCDLMERLIAIDSPAFAGTLSGLWLGDQLIAGHLGMRSDRAWHYWFPGYEQSLAKFSPGLLLLLEMAQACESLALVEIDLGKGEAPYKHRLASGEVPIAEGLVEVPGLATSAARACRKFDTWANRARWARPATIPGRLARKIQRNRKFA